MNIFSATSTLYCKIIIISVVEMPVQSILAAMELTGMAWDSGYANLVWSRVETKMTELQELAYSICDRKFNLGSRTDVSKVSYFKH